MPQGRALLERGGSTISTTIQVGAGIPTPWKIAEDFGGTWGYTKEL